MIENIVYLMHSGCNFLNFSTNFVIIKKSSLEITKKGNTYGIPPNF
jgi:hypothetical protein